MTLVEKLEELRDNEAFVGLVVEPIRGSGTQERDIQWGLIEEVGEDYLVLAHAQKEENGVVPASGKTLVVLHSGLRILF